MLPQNEEETQESRPSHPSDGSFFAPVSSTADREEKVSARYVMVRRGPEPERPDGPQLSGSEELGCSGSGDGWHIRFIFISLGWARRRVDEVGDRGIVLRSGKILLARRDTQRASRRTVDDA